MYKMGVVRNVVLVALLVLLLGAGCYGPVRTATIGKRKFATETWFEANHPCLMPITVPAGALYDTVVFSLDTTFMLTANMVWRPMFETYPEPLKPEWPALAVYTISPLAVAITPLILNPIMLIEFIDTTNKSDEYKQEFNERLKNVGLCFGTLPIVGIPYHGYRIVETWDKYEKIFGRHYLGPSWEDKQERERQKEMLVLKFERQKRENDFKEKLHRALALSDKCKLLLDAKEEFGLESWWEDEKESICIEINVKVCQLSKVSSYEEAKKQWLELGVEPVMECLVQYKTLFGDTYDYQGLSLPCTFETFPWHETITKNLLKKWSNIEIALSHVTSLEAFNDVLQKNDYPLVIEQGEECGIDVNEWKEKVARYQTIAELKDAIRGGNNLRVEEICTQERIRLRHFNVSVDFLIGQVIELEPHVINLLLERQWLSGSTISEYFERNGVSKKTRVGLLKYAFIEGGSTLLAKIILKVLQLNCNLRDFDVGDAELVKYCLLNDKISNDDVEDVSFARKKWKDRGVDEIVLIRLLKSGLIIIKTMEGGGFSATTSNGVPLREINNTYGYITKLWGRYSREIQQAILQEHIGNLLQCSIQKVLGDSCLNDQNFKDAQQWYLKCWRSSDDDNENSQVVVDAKTELITLYSRGQIILSIEDAQQLYDYHPEQKVYAEGREIAEVLNDVLRDGTSLRDEYLKKLLKMNIVKEKKPVDPQVISSLWALIYQYNPSFFVENYEHRNERFKGELFLETNPKNYVGLAMCCVLYGKVEKIKIAAWAIKEEFSSQKQDNYPEPLVSFYLWLKDSYKLNRLLEGFKLVPKSEAFYKRLVEQEDNHGTSPIDYAVEKVVKEQKWGIDSLSLFKDYCGNLDEGTKTRLRNRIKARYPKDFKQVINALGISNQ